MRPGYPRDPATQRSSIAEVIEYPARIVREFPASYLSPPLANCDFIRGKIGTRRDQVFIEFVRGIRKKGACKVKLSNLSFFRW